MSIDSVNYRKYADGGRGRKAQFEGIMLGDCCRLCVRRNRVSRSSPWRGGADTEICWTGEKPLPHFFDRNRTSIIQTADCHLKDATEEYNLFHAPSIIVEELPKGQQPFPAFGPECWLMLDR